MENERIDIGEGTRISLGRLNTLTDCIFALCLILLVIFIEKPLADMAHTEENIQSYLLGQRELMFTYILTFINISFYWYFSHNVSKLLRRSDGVHVWLTMLALLFVGLLPYSNALNDYFPESFTVHLFYSSIVFLVGLILCADWLYAIKNSRLVDRALSARDADGLIVEALIQPIAAIASIGGALISTFWWELPFMLVPFAPLVIGKIWARRKARG